MIILRYYDNIILDENIKDIKTLVNKGFGAWGYYAVCVSDKGKGLMEILSLSDALKSINNYKNYGIIAVVKGKSAAETTAAKLISQWLKDNKNLKDFKEYYNVRCR